MHRGLVQHIWALIFIITTSVVNAGSWDRILTPTYSFLGGQDAGRIGYYLAAAGDVNSDGLGDFLIGSYHTSLHGWNSGAVFLMLGRKQVNWELNCELNEVADAVFRGKDEYEMVGYNMVGEGDFNGDGFDDLLIGAPGNWKTYPPIPGYLYIVYGKANPDWGFDCILMDEADVTIIGEDNFDQFGYASCFIDDINDDGYDDILSSAPFRNQDAEWAGKAYLILGRADMGRDVKNIMDIASATFVYPRYQGNVGSAMDGVDDVNQDGKPDFVISAKGIGTSFLILGRDSVDWGYDFDLTNADCIFYPEHRNDDGGWQVKSAGDMNGDGYPDFLISGLEIRWESGKVYAIFGRDEWPAEGINLYNANASFMGEGAYDQAGVSINGLGDFTGDGIDDIIIGARYHFHDGPGTRVYHRGKAYIIEGKRTGWSRDVMLGDIEYYFDGEDSVSCAGWGVSTAGDVDGDSRPDLIISAPFNDDGRDAGYYVGEVYVVMGDYPVRPLSGHLLYHHNQKSVPSAEIVLSGDTRRTVETENDGSYTFNLSYGNNFTVKAQKDALEDVKNDNITIYDAALIAVHTVKLDTLSGKNYVAADVNEDNDVNMYDAALIAHHAVGLTGGDDSHVGEWRFNPEQIEVKWNQLPSYNNDFQAILLGEVSGNWSADTTQHFLAKSNVRYEWELNDDQVRIRFYGMPDIIATEMQLGFDRSVLEFTGVERTNATKSFNLLVNSNLNNKVRIGMYGVHALEDYHPLCVINFKLKDIDVSKTTIKIDRYVMNELHIQASDILIKAGAGKKSDVPESYTLGNYPNPFNPETKIEYQLKDGAHIDIAIYNVRGEKVKTLYTDYQSSGLHQIIWNGLDDNGIATSSGVYMCVIKGKNFVIKKKMLKLK